MGLGCLSWCSGNLHILLSFIHFVVTSPAQGYVLAVLQLQSRWLSKSSLVRKGLGHLAWKILVPRKSYLVHNYLELINGAILTTPNLCPAIAFLWGKYFTSKLRMSVEKSTVPFLQGSV